MENNDLKTIGKCMAQNQIFLEQIGVSNDELLSIIEEIEMITFGAKITGAGDGGCVIALTKEGSDLSEYTNTTKYQTYHVSIQKTGMQVFNSQDDGTGMILIKLGGSIITNKEKPLSPRKKTIDNILKEVGKIKEPIIIVHCGV